MKALLSLSLVLLFGLLTWLAGSHSLRAASATLAVTCLAQGPDGLLVGTAGGLVSLRDTPRLELPGIAICGISPDGRWLATQGGCYRASDMRRLVSEPTTAVIFTPSGLVTGHAGGRVRLSSEGTGVEVVCPTTATIHSLAFDGEHLWAAAADGLWRVTPRGAEKASPSFLVTSMVAEEGNLLVGTPWGVYRHSQGEWTRISDTVGVTALTPGNPIAVGTCRGVVGEEGGPSEVSALLRTADGLVVGTRRRGAFRNGKPLYSGAIRWEGF